MKPKFLILLPFFTLLLSCKTDESGLSRREKKILKECYKTVIESAPYLIDSTYIVNPYFASFEFNKHIANYSNNSRDKYNVEKLEKVGLNEEEFSFYKKRLMRNFKTREIPI
jgi:hypothetical protein